MGKQVQEEAGISDGGREGGRGKEGGGGGRRWEQGERRGRGGVGAAGERRANRKCCRWGGSRDGEVPRETRNREAATSTPHNYSSRLIAFI